MATKNTNKEKEQIVKSNVKKVTSVTNSGNKVTVAKQPVVEVKHKKTVEKPTVQVIKKADLNEECVESARMSRHAQEYLDKKAKKRKRKIVFWAITAVVLTILIIIPLILWATLESDAWIMQFTFWNIISPREADNLPYIVVILLRIFYTVFFFYLGIKGAYIITRILSIKANNRIKTIVAIIFSFTKYVLIIVCFFTVLGIAGVNVAMLLTGAGVLGLIIGFGAQSLVSDILSGLFIVFENTFEVGDIILFNDMRGEVIHIGIRTTKILAVDGNVHVINNSELRIVTNMTQHRSVALCDVTISFDENLERVEKIIKDSLTEIAYRHEIITEGPDYLGVAEFNASGMTLRIIAKCNEADRMRLTRTLNKEFKLLFDKHNIKIAVPGIVIKK